MTVVPLEAAQTLDLRRRVLYGHWPAAEVRYPQDDLEGAFHLGVVDDDGELVAVASWYPEPTPLRPGRRAYRLRGMAVDRRGRGQGAGRLLFAAGVGELRERRAEVVWANARDAALGFYRRLGMGVEGPAFLAAGGLPHHVVVLDLVAIDAGAAPEAPTGRRRRPSSPRGTRPPR